MASVRPLVWSLILLAAADSAGATELERFANIRFLLDERIFAVMAALNAAGFDYEANPNGVSPPRALVRRSLAALDPGLEEKLERFYLEHGGRDDPAAVQARYTSLSLWLEGPPSFKFSGKLGAAPREVRELLGFENLVAELYKSAEIARLWKQCLPYYQAEVERYRGAIAEIIRDVLTYLRSGPRVALDRQIILIPDLLNSHGFSNARNLENSYFLILGPATNIDEHKAAIRHEYLHFLLDPLIAKYGIIIVERNRLQRLALARPRAERNLTSDFFLVATESLLRAIEIRMSGAEETESRQMLENYDRGFILLPYFLEALRSYEQGGEGFFSVLPDLLAGIDVEREEKRAAEIDAARVR